MDKIGKIKKNSFNCDVVTKTFAPNAFNPKASRTTSIAYNGTFYNPGDVLAEEMAESLKAHHGKVRKIDPHTIELKNLSGLELKRALALKFINRYWFRHKSLKGMWFASKKHALTEAQCNLAIELGRKFRDQKKVVE